MDLYLPKHFKIQELVDPATYAKHGDSAIQFLHRPLILAIDTIREMTGKPITVNNWHQDGPFHWRGLRTPLCKEGAPGSQHRVGKAFDFDVAGMTAAEVRAWLQQHKDSAGLEAIMRMESGTSWCHIDALAGHGPRIHEFAP